MVVISAGGDVNDLEGASGDGSLPGLLVDSLVLSLVLVLSLCSEWVLWLCDTLVLMLSLWLWVTLVLSLSLVL